MRTGNLEDYNALRKSLDQVNVPYYTHMFKNQKLINLVVKGPPNLPIEHIKEDLGHQGIQTMKVTILRSKSRNNTEQGRSRSSDKIFHPCYLISVHPETDQKLVRMIRYICSVRVYWETFKNTKRVT